MSSPMDNAVHGRFVGNESSPLTDPSITAVEQRNAKRKVLESDFSRWCVETFKAAEVEKTQAALKNFKGSLEERKKLEEELRVKMRDAENRAYKISAKVYETTYKNASLSRKIELNKQLAEEEKARRKASDQMLKDELAALAIKYANNEKEYDKHAKDTIAKHNEYVKKSLDDEFEATKNANNLSLSAQNKYYKKLESIVDQKNKKAAESQEKYQNLLNSYNESVNSGLFSDAELREKERQVSEAQRAAENDAVSARIASNIKNSIESAFSQATKALGNGVADAFHSVETILTDYTGTVNSRLQGSGKTFKGILDLAVDNTVTSPYVKTQEVLNAVKSASDQGIAYNIEQRAFLATISDKIASTFDAFDSNLTRLIRLQQADTTAARLGMEARLTSFLNSMFEDNSYMGELSKSVSAAILDANSQLDRNASAEFEYVVQKWLGSLNSLGMSSNAIGNIAEGINYLATGNVSALASNNSLQTLFAMSASKAGLNYSDLLLYGMNADNTNKLLASMVSYLKEIAENSDNQVVKGAYGNIFNMSMSDFRAIQNLTSGDISSIFNSTMTYSGMLTELHNQFLDLSKRTTLSERIGNIAANASFGLGRSLFENPGLYAMMKMLDAMDALGVNINIPFVNAAGFGLDLNTDVNSLLRMSVGLQGSLGLLGSILSSLGSNGGLDLNSWKANEYTSRGSGFGGLLSTTLGGTSSSTYVSTNNMSDMKKSALSSATNDAEETSKITNANNKPEHTFDDFYTAVIGNEAKSYVAVKESYISRAYDEGNMWVRSHDDMVLLELQSVFGTSSFYDRRFNVSDNSIDKYASAGTIKVTDSGLSNVSRELSAIKTANQQQVSMQAASAGTVSIDERSLINALKNVLNTRTSTDPNTKSLQEVLNDLSQGRVTVRVKPETGTGLDVRIHSIDPTVSFKIRD